MAQLLKAGADANQAATGGWKPLHVASKYGHAKAVALLLGSGVQSDARAMLAAEAGGHTEVAELLRAAAD